VGLPEQLQLWLLTQPLGGQPLALLAIMPQPAKPVATAVGRLPVNLTAHAHTQVKADRFALMVEQLRKEYSNIKFSQPYSWVMYRRGACVAGCGCAWV